MTSEHSQRAAGPYLVSAASIGWASLFVNCLLGLALMLWNAIWLRRWGTSLLLAILICGVFLTTIKHFTPHPAWFLGNCILGLGLRKQSQTLFATDYFRSVFDGARQLSVVPLISVLSAVQIFSLTPMVKKQWLADIDPVRHPRLARNTPNPSSVNRSPQALPAPTSGHLVQGRDTVDYRDVPQAKAEVLARTLRETGYFNAGADGWAAFDETPQGLRVTLRLSPGQLHSPTLEPQYQKMFTAIDLALGSQGELWIEVYSYDRQTVRRYRPSGASR